MSEIEIRDFLKECLIQKFKDDSVHNVGQDGDVLYITDEDSEGAVEIRVEQVSDM